MTGDDASLDADTENGGVGDSYTNLEEFALGMNPTIWDAGSRESFGTVVEGETQYFEYMYYRRSDYFEKGLSYQLLDSTNLVFGDSFDAQDQVIVDPAVDSYDPMFDRYLIDEPKSLSY